MTPCTFKAFHADGSRTLYARLPFVGKFARCAYAVACWQWCRRAEWTQADGWKRVPREVLQ
jgi:hypothetical protein